MKARTVLSALLLLTSFPALAGTNWVTETGIPAPKIHMINNGKELNATRLELIAKAQHSIYFTTFHISQDEASKRIFDALCAKAQSGLEVRLMVEHHGSPGLRRQMRALRACGAFVVYQRPWIGKLAYALHEKLLIVDGERMITGGSGYQNWYTRASRASHYDMDFLIEGPVACRVHHDYQEQFQDRKKFDFGPNWARDYGLDRFSDCDEKAMTTKTEGALSRAVPVWGDPLLEKARPILDADLQSIDAAIESGGGKLRIYAPYFVPHPKFLKGLLKALHAGMEVEVLTNSVKTNDEHLRVPIVLAMKDAVAEFRAAGGKIFLWNGRGTMHRKGAAWGSVLASFGSDNFDNRGQEYSSEQVVFTDDPGVREQIAREFDEDITTMASPLTDDYIRFYEDAAKPSDRILAKLLRKLI